MPKLRGKLFYGQQIAVAEGFCHAYVADIVNAVDIFPYIIVASYLCTLLAGICVHLLIVCYLSGDGACAPVLRLHICHRIAVFQRFGISCDTADILVSIDRAERIALFDNCEGFAADAAHIVALCALHASVALRIHNDPVVHIAADAACAIFLGCDIAFVDAVCHQTLRDKAPAKLVLNRACRAVLGVLIVDGHRACDAAHIDIPLDNTLVDTGISAPGRDGINILIIDVLVQLLKAQALNVYYAVCQQVKHNVQLVVDCPKVIVDDVRIACRIVTQRLDAV